MVSSDSTKRTMDSTYSRKGSPIKTTQKRVVLPMAS